MNEIDTFREMVAQRDVILFWGLAVLAFGWLIFEQFYVTRLENIVRDCPKCRARAGLKKNKDTPSPKPPTDTAGA